MMANNTVDAMVAVAEAVLFRARLCQRSSGQTLFSLLVRLFVTPLQISWPPGSRLIFERAIGASHPAAPSSTHTQRAFTIHSQRSTMSKHRRAESPLQPETLTFNTFISNRDESIKITKYLQRKPS
jgi:hypothetical protein